MPGNVCPSPGAICTSGARTVAGIALEEASPKGNRRYIDSERGTFHGGGTLARAGKQGQNPSRMRAQGEASRGSPCAILWKEKEGRHCPPHRSSCDWFMQLLGITCWRAELSSLPSLSRRTPASPWLQWRHCQPCKQWRHRVRRQLDSFSMRREG